MINDYTKTALALLFIMWMLPHCSEKSKPKIKTYDAGIALEVQEDVLKAAIERRLYRLEHTTFAPAKEKPVQRKIQVRSSLEEAGME